jgi:hypothetical protein
MLKAARKQHPGRLPAVIRFMLALTHVVHKDPCQVVPFGTDKDAVSHLAGAEQPPPEEGTLLSAWYPRVDLFTVVNSLLSAEDRFDSRKLFTFSLGNFSMAKDHVSAGELAAFQKLWATLSLNTSKKIYFLASSTAGSASQLCIVNTRRFDGVRHCSLENAEFSAGVELFSAGLRNAGRAEEGLTSDIVSNLFRSTLASLHAACRPQSSPAGTLLKHSSQFVVPTAAVPPPGMFCPPPPSTHTHLSPVPLCRAIVLPFAQSAGW